jgi:hypothetical protein
MLRHPDHNDNSAGSDNYGSIGPGNVAGCCGADQSCAISEDTGLDVVTITANETCYCSNHDSNDDHLPVGQNPGAVDNYDTHVMALWFHVSSAKLFICSITFMKFF